MTSMGFILLADTLTPVLAAHNIKDEAMHVLEKWADDIREYAQQTAPWTDRTGSARAGLETSVTWDTNDDVVLSLYHTVDYGQWLETIQSGRFAVILPTLQHFEHQVMASVHAQDQGMEEGDI